MASTGPGSFWAFSAGGRSLLVLPARLGPGESPAGLAIHSRRPAGSTAGEACIQQGSLISPVASHTAGRCPWIQACVLVQVVSRPVEGGDVLTVSVLLPGKFAGGQLASCQLGPGS